MNQPALPTRMTVVVASLVLMATGCQTTGPAAKYNPFPNLMDTEVKSTKEVSVTAADGTVEEFEVGTPARMAVLWNETAIAPPSGKATRGFGGRVYFYDANNEPIRVDGQFHVYAYDDTDDEDQIRQVPDREYVFKADQLQSRYSETSIGPSYNLWIPWDEVGGFRKTVSLIPVFRPTEGAVVRSEQTLAILPGKDPIEEIEALESTHALVRQVNATVQGNERLAGSMISPETKAALQRRQPTTIRVPNRLANRMRNSRRGGSNITTNATNTAKLAKPASMNALASRSPMPSAPANTATAVTADASNVAPVAAPTGRSSAYGQPGQIR